MRGKLIVIEGTDCSGKETQANKLIEKLARENIKIIKYSFPAYDTPTGRIVGGPYLGKSYICDGWFSEGAPNVDPKVSALYFAADRKYNISQINEKLDQGCNVVLDRYIYSNMAHQGGKLGSKRERNKMYKWLEKLEFGLLELPPADIKVFLHMPYEASLKLKENRSEGLDQNERSKSHLLNAERAYIEIAEKYDFFTIECAKGEEVRSIGEIHMELYNYIKDEVNEK